MSDRIGPLDPVGGEYTDSELPLDAALPKEEYTEVEHLLDEDDDVDDDELDDVTIETAEMDVEVVEIVEPEAGTPPDRETPR